MKKNYVLKLFIALLIICGAQNKAKAQSFTEGFENLGTLVDWYVANTSDNASTTVSWFKGIVADFPAQAGTDSSYVASDYQVDSSTTAAGTLSSWLITPNRIFNNGDVVSFYTRTIGNPATYPDNLQVRLSTNGTSLNVGTTSATVGDFTTLLLEINPTLSTTVYPGVWTQYTITISGLVGPTSGRVAFRYYVTNGGPIGTNSDYIGVDTYSYTSNTSSTDATVSNVYTLGTIAKPYINPHVVTANITNTGNTTLTNEVVTLNVTGANTFTNTQTIASLAAGASAIVTFAGYTSNTAGTNTVTVSVPADAVITGNTMSVTQTVNTSSYNYAYGTTVTSGVGFNGATGFVAAKFNTSSATSISSVNVNLNSTGRAYTMNIWDATGAGGTPGTLLYTSAGQTSVIGVLPITVSPAVAVNGGFFVGLSQNDTSNMAFSYQTESPVRTGKFYYNISTVGTWTDFATNALPFRLMIEPVFGCAAPAQPGAVTGTSAVCQGTSQTYSITAVSGATSYTWTLPGGWSGTSTTNSITAFTGATGGNITVTATNGCGTSTAQTFAVTIATTPTTPGTISGNASVCQTSSQTYSVVAVAGATSYNWTLPGGWSGTSTTNSITTVAGANSGAITVSASNTCGTSSPVTFAVTVNPVPVQPGAITGNTSVCQGVSQNYSISAVAGATSYTWTLPGGWSGTSTTTSIVAMPGAGGGVLSVTANNACGASAPSVLTIAVSSTPLQPGAITGPLTFCPSQPGTYSVNAVAGATSYNWTLPSGWSGTSTTNTINTTSSAIAGTISVTASNTCGTSAAQTLSVTLGSTPLQPGGITGVTTICPGQTQVYSVNPVAGAITYNWTLPGGWSGSSTTTSISALTTANGGTISVTATNACGTSPAQTLAITLGSAPLQPGAITGNATICSGSTQTYSISPVAGAVSYNWTLPSGWSGASSSTTITGLAGTTSGQITVVAINDCGTSAPQTMTVTVSSTPATPAVINGSTAVCSGISGTYSVAPVAGATSYNWTLPTGWSGSSTTNTITASGTLTGTIYVTVSNTCGTSLSQSLTVTVSTAAPAQPGAISGNTTVCSLSTTTYSVTPVANATSYNWTLPGGWSGTSTTNSIIVTVGTTGGSISVSASNGCGTSAATASTITVNTSPAIPGTITGNTTMCANSSQTYSIASVVGATNYTWTFPTGWSGSSITTSITGTAGQSGNILVTANNAQCSSPAQTLAVVVNTAPAMPGSIGGNTTVCSAGNETYTIAAVTGATSYNWTLPSGWSGTSATNSISSTVGTTGGIVSVTASNTCGTSAAQTLSITVNVVPVQPGVITGNATVCSNSTQTYSIGAVAGATGYTWTLPVGWTITSGTNTNTITCTAGSAGGSIMVTANNGTCAGPAQTLAITMNNVPPTPGTITGPVSICAGSTHTYAVAAVAGATGYVWTLPAAWTGTSVLDSISATAMGTTGAVMVAASNVCGTGAASSVTVTVNALPATPTITVNGNVLQSSTGTTYQWFFNGTAITGATTQFLTMTGMGSYSVVVTNASGCTSAASAFFVNTGINQLSIDEVFNVFPNPASEVINITLVTNLEVQSAVITNIVGKTVKVINAKTFKGTDTYTVGIEDLSKGMYFVSMQVDGRLMTRKIVVQ